MRSPRWRLPGRGRGSAFLRIAGGDLDIAMPPPYDMSDAAQRQARQTVEKLLGQLRPDGLDGNSRDVLNNLINDWIDQDIARLSAHRAEWTAVSRILIGLAREEVARRQPRYDADYSRAQRARQALAVTYQQLTGKDLADLPSSPPRRDDPGPVGSTLGHLVLPEDDGAPLRGHAGTGRPDAGRPDPGHPSANGHGQPRPADDGPAEPADDDPIEGA
jgi:hypothetical protein